jgi:hypothetical protein
MTHQTAIELLKSKVSEYRSLQNRLAAADEMMREVESLIKLAPPDLSKQLESAVKKYRAG